MLIMAVVAGAYLIGSIPTAYIVGKLGSGIDIRKYGSGNVGTMNTRAVLGYRSALLVLVIDVGKGLLSVYLAQKTGTNPYLVLFMTISGHICSIWLKGSGGKGLATILGGLLGLKQWLPVVAFSAVWVPIYLITKNDNLSTLLSALAVLPSAWLLVPHRVFPGIVLIILPIIVKHSMELGNNRGRQLL